MGKLPTVQSTLAANLGTEAELEPRSITMYLTLPKPRFPGTCDRPRLVMLNSNPLVNNSDTYDLEKVWVKGVEVALVVKLSTKESTCSYTVT